MPLKFLITSISEDLLSIIFEYVFSASSAKFEDETTHQNLPAISILKLSHVNRQFRHTSLSNPHLWTYIAGEGRYPTMGLVNACFERSRNVPLTVNLYVYINPFHGPSCDTVLEAARPHAHRWRTVHLRFFHIRYGPDFPLACGFVGALRGLDKLQDISTPALEHLVLHNDPITLNDEFDFIESWNTPSLRSLVTEFCFPSKLPPESFQAITSLEMRFSLRCADFFDLLALLRASKMPNLTDLSLHFDHHERFWGGRDIHPAPHMPDFSLPSIQRLRVTNYSKTRCDIHSEGSERTHFRALSFPNVRELSITLVCEALKYDWPRLFVYLDDSLNRIFSTMPTGDIQFPLLSHLHINICSYGFKTDILASGLASFGLFLHVLPSLRELYIHSNMPLAVSPYGVANREQPALKRIEVDVPRLGSESESSVAETSFRTAPELWTWIRGMANALTAQGVWREFEELVLTERVYGAELDGSGVKDIERVFSRDMLVQAFNKHFDKEPTSG